LALHSKGFDSVIVEVMSMPIDPPGQRTVLDDLGSLIHEVITFGKTVGVGVAQLDDHRQTLDDIKKLLTSLEETKKRELEIRVKENELKAMELEKLDKAGNRNHEFRMRILHGFGGLLTGSALVPGLLYYFLGYEPHRECPPVSVPAPAEVKDVPE
jgi:hypothetical protein